MLLLLYALSLRQAVLQLLLLLLALLLLFQTKEVNCALKPLADETKRRLSLTQCVRRAGERYFRDNDETVTVSIQTSRHAPEEENSRNAAIGRAVALDVILLRELFQTCRCTVYLTKATNDLVNATTDRIKSDSYILILRVIEELEVHLTHLKKSKTWNPHAKFIIASVVDFSRRAEVISKIFELLWKFDVLNGIVFLPDKSTTFIIYTWFPYLSGKCGKSFNEVEKLTTCAYGNYSEEVDLFPNKIPRNLNKCPVRVSTFPYPPYVSDKKVKFDENGNKEVTFSGGMEVNLLNLVSNYYNFSVNYLYTDTELNWGSVSRNGSGILGHLLHAQTDVAIASFAISVDRHLALDYSDTYFLDSLKFCVPHAKPQPQWKKLIHIIPMYVYVMLATTMIIVTMMLHRCSIIRNKRERKYYQQKANVLHITWGILLNQSTKPPPRTYRVRLFLLIWIILSLHLDTNYQSILMSSLTKPDYEHQISTVEEILEQGYIMYFNDAARRYFNDKEDASLIQQRILQKWRTCENYEYCFNLTAKYKNSSIALSRLYSSYALGNYQNRKGESLIYCFDTTIVTYPIVMYMRKGLPLRNAISNLINNINAAGFLDWWEKSIFKERQIENLRKFDGERLLYIELKHLYPLFIVLFVGLGISLIVFICEIVYFKNQHTF